MNKITIRRNDEVRGGYGSIKLYIDKKEVASLKKKQSVVIELANGEYTLVAKQLTSGQSNKYVMTVNNEDKEVVYGTYKSRIKKIMVVMLPIALLVVFGGPILQIIGVLFALPYSYRCMYQIKEVEPKI